MSELQLFDALSTPIEDALRASIRRFGVLVPVARDQHGRIIDGHHRVRLADEEGVNCPEVVITVADDDEAREIARTLNADRRQLTEEQRRAVVADLRRGGHSERAIAGALGVSQATVHRDIGRATDSGESVQPDRVRSLDGKSRPAVQSRRDPDPEPEPEPGGPDHDDKRPDPEPGIWYSGPAERESPPPSARKAPVNVSRAIAGALADIDRGRRALERVDLARIAHQDDETRRAWAAGLTEHLEVLHHFLGHLNEESNTNV
jgi:site-specific DNA-methyltransferase (adenine-specific)